MTDEFNEEFVFESEPVFPWVYPERPMDLPIPESAVATFNYTWIKGQGGFIRVVSVPGSDHAMYMEETDNCFGCSNPIPAVWNFTVIDPSVFPFKVATCYTLDIHAAVFWISNPEAIFEMTEEGYDGAPMASFANRVTVMPEFTGAEALLQDCVNWLAAEMSPEQIEWSGLVPNGFGAADLVDGDTLADSFREILGGDDVDEC